MARIKKITLAALVALALAAGGVAVGGEAAQIASSKGDKADVARESSYQIGFIDDEEIIEQLASSAGTRAKIARESA